jgi:hypothetical protein
VLRQICCDVLLQKFNDSLRHVSTLAFDACAVIIVAFKRTHQILCRFDAVTTHKR